MKKRFLLFFLFPLLLSGCSQKVVIDHPQKTGEIGEFALTSPANGFSTGEGFTFEW